MTNDTTTLNGALRELGETIAANLTTQGVPSTYDEGLTTLAGKILDISSGSTVASISLTGSTSILSYADSDTLTLTATLLDSNSSGVSGQTVTFYNGSTSMGTTTTNSNGVATKTYSSTGAGDISFTASCSSISSETYVVEDCLYYDDCLTDKSNNFTINKQSSVTPVLTHDTDHYVVTSSSEPAMSIALPSVTSPIQFEADINAVTRVTNHNIGIMISNMNSRNVPGTGTNQGNAYEVFSYSSSKGFAKITNGTWSSVNRPSGVLSKNTWYHYTISIDGTSVTATITTGNSTVYSYTYTGSFSLTTLYPIIYLTAGSMEVHFKNLKVKPL